jgi:hypothetical protein
MTQKKNTSAQNIPTGNNLQKPYFEISRGKVITPVKSANKKRENPMPEVQNYFSVLISTPTIAIKPEELSSLLNTKNLFVQPVIIHKTDDLGLNTAVASDKIVALNTKLNLPPDNNGMSNVARFIARTFREKILREKVTKNTPLQGYEIAEAGVTGLNMLLGWNMALNEKNDANGELKSVYFSSKILNFNAPVKKNVPQP